MQDVNVGEGHAEEDGARGHRRPWSSPGEEVSAGMAGRYPEEGRRATRPHGVVPAARLMCYLQPRHLYSPTKSDSWRSGGDTQFSSSRRFWKVPSQKTLVVPASSLMDLW